MPQEVGQAADARSRRTVLVALGANLPSALGPPEATVARALATLPQALGAQGAARPSALYATPCFPLGAGPDYVNAALAVTSDLDPEEVLARLHAIEAAYGRVRAGRWGGRPLDLDLLATGGLVRPDAATAARWIALAPERQRREAPRELVLPHPRLQDRAFVLVPLAEVAPDWRHPLLGLGVAELLARLPAEQIAGIRRLDA